MFHLKERSVAADCQVVHGGGELDMSAAPQLRETIDRAIEKDPVCLVVDLSEATFIDSTCIGLLIGARERLRARGGSVVVACATRNVRKTFEIAGLDGLVEIQDLSEEDVPVPVP